MINSQGVIMFLFGAATVYSYNYTHSQSYLNEFALLDVLAVICLVTSVAWAIASFVNIASKSWE